MLSTGDIQFFSCSSILLPGGKGERKQDICICMWQFWALTIISSCQDNLVLLVSLCISSVYGVWMRRYAEKIGSKKRTIVFSGTLSCEEDTVHYFVTIKIRNVTFEMRDEDSI